jgi:hypothetical protein
LVDLRRELAEEAEWGSAGYHSAKLEYKCDVENLA